MAKASKVNLKTKAPRSLKEIRDEYVQLVSSAGEKQYQLHVLSEDLKTVNARLVQVNHEAAARQQLDKEEAEIQAKVDTQKEQK